MYVRGVQKDDGRRSRRGRNVHATSKGTQSTPVALFRTSYSPVVPIRFRNVVSNNVTEIDERQIVNRLDSRHYVVWGEAPRFCEIRILEQNDSLRIFLEVRD